MFDNEYFSAFVIFLITSALIYVVRMLMKPNHCLDYDKNRNSRVLAIAGCDSGLGLSMAYWGAQLGYKVIAGCLFPDGKGAKYLKRNFLDDHLKVVPLDVTCKKSVNEFYLETRKFLDASNGGKCQLRPCIRF